MNMFAGNVAEEILCYMSIPGKRLEKFDGAVPMCPAFDNAIVSPQGELDWLLEAPPTICGPLDFKLLFPSKDIFGERSRAGMPYNMESRYAMYRTRSVSGAVMKSLRFPAHLTGIRCAFAKVNDAGRVADDEPLWVWSKSSGYRCEKYGSKLATAAEIATTDWGRRSLSGREGVIKTSVALNWLLHYEWSVKIRFVDSLSIRLPVDAEAIHSLFKLRSLPEGVSRRPALLHWVREHLRASRKDPAALNYVREHIRGGTDFRWGDLIVSIRPSSDELKDLMSSGNKKAKAIVLAGA